MLRGINNSEKSVQPIYMEKKYSASENMLLSPAALTGTYMETVDIPNISSPSVQEGMRERNFSPEDKKMGSQYNIKVNNTGSLAIFLDELDYASQKLLKEREIKMPAPSMRFKNSIKPPDEFHLFDSFYIMNNKECFSY